VRGVYIQCFVNIEPVQRSEDGCDMKRFRSFNHTASKTVLSRLGAIRETIVVERVTVVKFRADNRGNFQ